MYYHDILHRAITALDCILTSNEESVFDRYIKKLQRDVHIRRTPVHRVSYILLLVVDLI